ncbi:MAG TPA: hypothetical protein VLB84_10180 [Bacteroidia bacterium]|jgi:hypothetical protein|nr:hypothetical protein [Bacteroidia bacterium]
MEHKDIIITLIKDHLTNTRLIKGLNSLGWQSEDYHLHLSDIIFKLIGISDEKEELFEVYLEWCTKMAKTEIFNDSRLLDEYATEIYCVLLGEAQE